MTRYSIVAVLTTLLVCLLSLSASAEIRTITLDMVRDQTEGVRVEMPCNWNKSLSQTRVMGYYGSDAPYADVHMEDAKVSMHKGNVLITFPPEALSREDYGDLHHVEFVFRVTNKKCRGSFGFETLSK